MDTFWNHDELSPVKAAYESALRLASDLALEVSRLEGQCAGAKRALESLAPDLINAPPVATYDGVDYDTVTIGVLLAEIRIEIESQRAIIKNKQAIYTRIDNLRTGVLNDFNTTSNSATAAWNAWTEKKAEVEALLEARNVAPTSWPAAVEYNDVTRLKAEYDELQAVANALSEMATPLSVHRASHDTDRQVAEAHVARLEADIASLESSAKLAVVEIEAEAGIPSRISKEIISAQDAVAALSTALTEVQNRMETIKSKVASDLTAKK